MLDKTLRANRLFDFYGPLLTGNQKEMFRLYYREDWSLSEVAENMDCSRQAVHDTLERSMARLQEYDDQLRLIDAFEERAGRLEELRELLEERDMDDHVMDLLDELLEHDLRRHNTTSGD